jgi:hypothetical protein
VAHRRPGTRHLKSQRRRPAMCPGSLRPEPHPARPHPAPRSTECRYSRESRAQVSHPPPELWERRYPRVSPERALRSLQPGGRRRSLRAKARLGPQWLDQPDQWLPGQPGRRPLGGPERSPQAGRAGPIPLAWRVPRWPPPPDGQPLARSAALGAPTGLAARGADPRLRRVCPARRPQQLRAAPARQHAPEHGRPTRAGASVRAPAKRTATQGSQSRPARQTPRSPRSW